MTNQRLAVICAGHARWVHRSYTVNSSILDSVPQLSSWHIYSMAWTQASDPRAYVLDSWDHNCLRNLGPRSVVKEQADQIYHCYSEFLTQDAFSVRNTQEDQKIFARFMGQILAFVQALDHWRSSLKSYDWIVRSRWDMLLDRSVLDMITEDAAVSRTNTFYTKSMCMINGHGSVSGDVIYGPARAWLDLIPSQESAVQQLISQCRSQRRVFEDIYHRPFYLDGFWFNSHSLWHMLFNQRPYDLKTAGESMNITTLDQPKPPPPPDISNARQSELRRRIEQQILEDHNESLPRLFKN